MSELLLQPRPWTRTYAGDPCVHLVREDGDGALTLCGRGVCMPGGVHYHFEEGIDQEGPTCSLCGAARDAGVAFLAADVSPLELTPIGLGVADAAYLEFRADLQREIAAALTGGSL